MNDSPGQPRDARAAYLRERYHLSAEEAALSAEREVVYGEAYINHLGIAQTWCGLLHPWVLHMAQMQPLPPHVVANMMDGLKLNRKRQVFHGDNYDDSSVYSRFACTWQREWAQDGRGPCPSVVVPAPHPDCTLVLEWEAPDGTRIPATR